MAYQFKIRRLVEFSDMDMAGIVHHAVFYRYMESAEHAFFRTLG
jgi:acyl-CoA thioesterase FadM